MIRETEALSNDADEEVKRLYTRPAKKLRLAGQLREALALLDEGLERFAHHERILCSRGEVFKCLGNTAKARECFEATLKINPRNEVARYMIAKSEFLNGRSGAARMLLFQLISETPCYKPILLYLFAACVDNDDPFWPVLESAMGADTIKKAREIGKNYERFEMEERNYLYRNTLWERLFSSQPVNKMALKGVTEFDW